MKIPAIQVKRTMTRWRCILVFCLAAATGQYSRAVQTPAPKTYFVSPSGSDSSPGTEAAPWRTLGRAARWVAAGDTVVVRAGGYSGFILGWDAPQNGAPSAPITFKAEPGAVIHSRNPKTPDGINLEGASYIVIDGFTIDNGDGSIARAGIRATSDSHVVIRNNTTDQCGTWGIFTSFSQDVLIENNVASHAHKQHGIYVSNTCDRPIVRGNQVFGNHMCGIHMNGDVSQGGKGIITNALIENNVIHDNGAAGGSAINCDGVRDSRIQNNLIYDNHSSGISLYRIDAAGGATGNVVVNNTIVMASNARWAINIKNASTGNTVYNNILYDENSAHGSINIAADSLDGFVSDYNAVDGHFSPNDDDRITLSAWRQVTGQDQHSSIANPGELFVNAAAGDYRPCVSSPAIGAGTSLPAPRQAPVTDLSGKPRPTTGKWDVGAYLPTTLRPMGAMHHVRRYWAALFAMLALAGLGGVGGFCIIRSRGLDRWLGPYCLQMRRRRPVAANQPVHVMLCVADHFEPGNGGVGEARAQARVDRWIERYPTLFAEFRDSDGRPPRHTFFYPIEQYNSVHLDALASLCRAGFGEVEIHLHHDRDTEQNLRKTLIHFKNVLATRHELLARDPATGRIAYAFVHGNWALDNSHPDGLSCGVNNELDVLRETGCYADFTLPAAPHPSQTRKINSIYYATDDPMRPKSHDTGLDVGAGPAPDKALMLVQGPLLLDWGRRKWGVAPRIENACIQQNQLPTLHRLDLWMRARVQVPTRPDWFFVKLHCHGANEAGQSAVLAEPMVRFHRDLARRAAECANFHYHYVTARETYNLVRAAESGWTGSVADARDFELKWNGAATVAAAPLVAAADGCPAA
jgi:parallel beta-helix repeat protein